MKLVSGTFERNINNSYFKNFKTNFDDGILRAHNQKVYNKIIKGFSQGKKVMFEQATGTGKSYLAIKFLIDHAQGKRVLFVSPANVIDEYFIDTSLKTLLNYTDEKLDSLSKQRKLDIIKQELDIELETSLYQGLKSKAENKYDIIIFDEAHRMGAPTWGKSVENLMQNNPDAVCLGMSATLERNDGVNIKKYFNNREPVSRYSLADALIDGVLPNPNYTLAKVDFGDDEKFIDSSIADFNEKLKTATGDERKEILSFLDQLKKAKRMIADSDDIPTIINKQFDKTELLTGKYLIFCPAGEDELEDGESIHRMKSIMQQAEDWFAQVAGVKKIKKYSVYSKLGNKLNHKIIKAFEKDKSKSLKLLYSINMLNEGLHVDDIDGIIMLRGTSSRIIYLQQLGRGLSVGLKKNPLVLDLVANLNYVEVEEIKSLAKKVNKGRAKGKDGEGVGGDENPNNDKTQKFGLNTENYDEIEFVDALRKNIFAYQHKFDFEFEDFYSRLIEYKNLNEDLLVASDYCCEDGYPLGQKIVCVRRGTIHITDNQQQKLNLIGFVWNVLKYKGVRKHIKQFVQRYNSFVKAYHKEPTTTGNIDGEKALAGLKKKYTDAKVLNEAEISYLIENGLVLRNMGDNIRPEIKRFVKDYKDFVNTHQRKPNSKKEQAIYQRWLQYTDKANLTLEEIEYLTKEGIELREKFEVQDGIRPSVRKFVEECLKFYETEHRKPSVAKEPSLYQRYVRYTDPKFLTDEEKVFILENNIERYNYKIRPIIVEFVENLEKFLQEHDRMPRKTAKQPEERKLYGQFYRYTIYEYESLNEYEREFLEQHGIGKPDKDKIIRNIVKDFVKDLKEFVKLNNRLPDRTLEENFYRKWLKFSNPENLNGAEIQYLKENDIELREKIADIRNEVLSFVRRYVKFVNENGRKPKKIQGAFKDEFEREEKALYKLWIKYSNSENVTDEEKTYLINNGIDVRIVKKVENRKNPRI